jgi:hypothetical protein
MTFLFQTTKRLRNFGKRETETNTNILRDSEYPEEIREFIIPSTRKLWGSGSNVSPSFPAHHTQAYHHIIQRKVASSIQIASLNNIGTGNPPEIGGTEVTCLDSVYEVRGPSPGRGRNLPGRGHFCQFSHWTNFSL